MEENAEDSVKREEELEKGVANSDKPEEEKEVETPASDWSSE